MPRPYPPFTEEEIAQLKVQYQANVERFNTALPDGMKIKLDLAQYEIKLRDQNYVDKIKMAQELHAQNQIRHNIHEDLRQQFGPLPQNEDYLNRTFFMCYKTEDTPEAREYNKQQYLRYKSNPLLVFNERMKKVATANPSSLYDNMDNQMARIESYAQDPSLYEDAYAFESQLSNLSGAGRDQLVPALNTSLKHIKLPIENFSMVQSEIRALGNPSFVTVPELTVPQAALIMQDKEIIGNETDNVIYYLEKNLNSEVEHFKDNANWDRTNNFFLAKKAINAQGQEVSLNDQVTDPNPNVRLVDRSEEEINQMLHFTKKYEERLVTNFEYRFDAAYRARQNVPADYKDFINPAYIEEKHKGSIFERMFFRTSNQYKEFLKALKEVQTPGHKNYANFTLLKNKANAYIDHKKEQYGPELENLDATGSGRVALCQAALSVCSNEEELARPLTQEMSTQIEPAIIDANVVEDNPQVEQEQVNEFEQEVVEVEDELNNSI